MKKDLVSFGETCAPSRFWRYGFLSMRWNVHIETNFTRKTRMPLFMLMCDKQNLNSKKQWVSALRYYHFFIEFSGLWGRKHMYYDGPRDSFHLGFLHFSWSDKWCEKCYNEG